MVTMFWELHPNFKPPYDTTKVYHSSPLWRAERICDRLQEDWEAAAQRQARLEANLTQLTENGAPLSQITAAETTVASATQRTDADLLAVRNAEANVLALAGQTAGTIV